jgi:hypothetical protein
LLLPEFIRLSDCPGNYAGSSELKDDIKLQLFIDIFYSFSLKINPAYVEKLLNFMHYDLKQGSDRFCKYQLWTGGTWRRTKVH